ncbi:MAG: hypothetical protein U0573_14255 [Phycisphaerales bacterium]
MSLLVLLAAGELLARKVAGLGDPPLYIADPKIEYLNKPGHYDRFHHTIHINQWSQRSPDAPEKKADPNELRVLVIGDSVVYGGARIDDRDTATALLTQSLASEEKRPVFVANISAGSWGPPNQLEYLKRFGTFDADAAIVVWSSHDAWDVPEFSGLGIELPQQKPASALWELIRRYGIPKLFPPPAESPPHTQKQVDEGLAAAKELLEILHARGIPTAVVIHRTQDEFKGKDLEGDRLLAAVAKSENLPVYYTASVLEPAWKAGKPVFFDDIHPSTDGNRLLSGLYTQIVDGLLHPVPASPAPAPAPPSQGH